LILWSQIVETITKEQIMNFVYVVYYMDSDRYEVAGIFDNRDAALACVETFKNCHAYASNTPLNLNLVRLPEGSEGVL